jgi:hypothetical protein
MGRPDLFEYDRNYSYVKTRTALGMNLEHLRV